MGKNDLPKKYGKTVIMIHWLSVMLILTLFPLGKYMSGLEVSEKLRLVKLHGILGAIVFVLTILRSVLFFTSERPPHLSTGSKFNDLLAIGIQRSFYVLLLIIGFSGLASLIVGGYLEALTASPMLPELVQPRSEIGPLKLHNVLSMLLMFLAATHVIGVIRFNILHKTNVLKRIT